MQVSQIDIMKADMGIKENILYLIYMVIRSQNRCPPREKQYVLFMRVRYMVRKEMMMSNYS